MENTIHYDYIVSQLRTFFKRKGFVEVPAAYRTSILAACEDPRTITTYNLGGMQYPLPQTGQTWLEIELLKNPHMKGAFCLGPSYRDEPDVIKGRHNRLFPMFDFESVGTVDDLRQLESDLLTFLGFQAPQSVMYEDACQRYGVSEIDAEEETKLMNDVSPVITLEQFPLRSNPYFIMKREPNGLFNKIDVLLYGMETIGSSERSTDVDEMRTLFYETSDGQFAQLLFDQFGKERVLKELEDYFALPMRPRFGGGIGITRLESAMEQAGLLDAQAIQNQNYSPAQAAL